LENEKIAGAEKLLIAYLSSLTREVNIAANASGVQGFRDISAKMEEAIEQTRQHNYASIANIVSETVSIATTIANQAAETLKEKDLI
jgi:hypothetical protein